jgi:hypothetical protein
MSVKKTMIYLLAIKVLVMPMKMMNRRLVPIFKLVMTTTTLIMAMWINLMTF